MVMAHFSLLLGIYILLNISTNPHDKLPAKCFNLLTDYHPDGRSQDNLNVGDCMIDYWGHMCKKYLKGLRYFLKTST